MKGYVYILRSLKNSQFYNGSTINYHNRIEKHNKGCVLSTRNARPWKIEFIQEYNSITQAKYIEYKLKKLKRRDYLEKIIRDKKIKLGDCSSAG